MLVDTIYREEYKKIAHATTKEHKQHEDKTIHTNDDISDNIENNGEIVNYDAWWLSYPDTDITKQLQSLPFQGQILYH